MRKTVLILSITVIFLLIVGVVLSSLVITGGIINVASDAEFDYIWTTAICDGNECRDYEVTCKNGSVKDLRAVTGLVIFPENWQDRREVNDSLCER